LTVGVVDFKAPVAPEVLREAQGTVPALGLAVLAVELVVARRVEHHSQRL